MDVRQFDEARRRRVAADAAKYRQLQAVACTMLFIKAHDREPRSTEELMTWAQTADIERPIDPFKALTERELQEIADEMPELFS